MQAKGLGIRNLISCLTWINELFSKNIGQSTSGTADQDLG